MKTSVEESPTFDLGRVRDLLGDAAGRFNVDHFVTCSSTNTLLLESAARGAPSGTVIIADTQTAGRGRRGRTWQSSPDHSLTFSLLWRFGAGISLSGLSLAVGVALARALEKQGVDGLALKWPNDIFLYGRKLGGVLVEVSFDERGAAAVIGIGLNLKPHVAWAKLIDQAFAALLDAGLNASRESLLAALLYELASVLDVFASQGFGALRADWLARHAYQDLPVHISGELQRLTGVCRGVDEQGALLLESDESGEDGRSNTLSVLNGDVSLRGA